MVNERVKLLIVDDELEIVNSVADYLEQWSFETIRSTQPETVMHMLEQSAVDLVIVDRMMQVLNGINLSKQIKQLYKIPILMLTAVDDDLEKVVALETVVDDYMTKPFSLRILMTHVKALLRRFDQVSKDTAIQQYQFNGWRLNLPQQQLYTPTDVYVALTQAEFVLLNTFLEQPNKTLSRDSLLEKLTSVTVSPDARRVDSLISQLRNKLCSDGDTQLISTIRQQGYCFNAKVTKA